jgi:hypothetical protein
MFSRQPSGHAIQYLKEVMDQYHRAFDVYTDSHAAGNHFHARGRMSSPGDSLLVPAMVESSVQNPHAGITCIEATLKASGANWGGWYFMNGVLEGSDRAPRENWGGYPNAGIDLRGATTLTFWARGAEGGEVAEFFAFGVGWKDPMEPFPDSSPKRGTGQLTLSSEWTRYAIDLYGADLRYVLGGFGWVADAQENEGRDITFYIDDVRYDKARLDDPRFLVSYETIPSSEDFDVVMRNVAFTYDNALALLAFLAAGETARARLLADAFMEAMEHDRFYDDGRIRNAYQGGDMTLPAGWTPNGREGTIRMPGWYDPSERMWFEDEFQVSTHTGNVAWAMLALEAAYESLGDGRYRSTALDLGNWVESHCRDARGAGGYTAGYEGWEPTPAKLSYKATEHNIDLTVAFERLYAATGNEAWQERAEHAKGFLVSMWDEDEGKFWTGTASDGVTINRAVVPLDIQAWAVLALEPRGKEKKYRRALDYAETHHRVGDGFDFNEDGDGIWYEGTAHMAAAYDAIHKKKPWEALASWLESAQGDAGGLPAADRDGLTTGFDLPSGDPWLYFDRAHVGATAWLVLTERGVNPFWMFEKHDKKP